MLLLFFKRKTQVKDQIRKRKRFEMEKHWQDSVSRGGGGEVMVRPCETTLSRSLSGENWLSLFSARFSLCSIFVLSPKVMLAQ